ncbi:MAG: lipocalin family protein, partial [Chitinophagaceae bacterium]
MKKIHTLLPLFILTFFLMACSASKEARTYKKTIDGSWRLQTVTTEGIMGKVKIQLFNEADMSCFPGSIWKFNNGNSLGTYTIDKNDCPSIVRDIRWTIYEPKDQPKQLQFERLTDKIKVIDDGNGYRFTIVQLDKNTMQLKSAITFENRPATVIYNFTRN